jgi:hypothetical protein
MDTINPTVNVTFILRELYADIYSYTYPNNAGYTSLELYVDTTGVTNTQLGVMLTGFLQAPAFTRIDYRYLLVLAGNTLFGDYIALSYTVFSWNFQSWPNINQSILPFPTYYTNGSTPKVITLLRDAEARYQTVFQHSYLNIVRLAVTSTVVNDTVVQSVDVSPYLSEITSVYRLRYTVLIYDDVLLETAKPQYTIQSGTASTNFNSYVEFS